MDEDFKMIVIPNYLNPDAPKGENLVLVFTIEEMEKATAPRVNPCVRNREAERGQSRMLQAAIRYLEIGLLHHPVQAGQNTHTSSGNHTRSDTLLLKRCGSGGRSGRLP